MIDLKPIKNYLVANIESLDECDELGLVYSVGYRFLTFIDDLNFVGKLDKNYNVTAVLWDEKLPLPSDEKHYHILLTKNSRLAFYSLLNSQNSNLPFSHNIVHRSAILDETVKLLGKGIEIQKNAIIEPYCTIYQGSIIGENAIIRSGSRIGAEDLEIKIDSSGNYLMIKHGGGVIIGDNVEIGHNAVIDRAVFRFDNTVIKRQSKIGNLSLVGHGCKIGEKNKIMPGTIIGGSTSIGNNNWIGANTVISNQIRIGSFTHITMGSTLLENLNDHFAYINNRKLKNRDVF